MMFRTLASCSLLIVTVGAQVVPVSGGGAALQNAILAAPNNAVLVVAPGTYSSVSAQVAKNVTIVAPQGAVVSGGLVVTFNAMLRLTVVGLTLQASPQNPGLLATNGHLHAEQCSATGLVVSSAYGVSTVYVRGGTFVGPEVKHVQNAHVVLLDAAFVESTQFPSSGLAVTGQCSLRAERISATGASIAPGPSMGGAGLFVEGDAVLVDSSFTGGFGTYQQNRAVYCLGQLTLSNCTLSGPVAPTPVLRAVPSASFVTENWTPGSTSSVRLSEAPNRLVATVVSTDLVPWVSPNALERLYVGQTPNWLITSVGVTGAGGDLVVLLTLPNVPWLQYAPVWVTGAFVDPLPLRTTCPLGGLVR